MDEQTRPSRRVRIVCISDTHNQTPKLPQGDILIHAGDLTNQGSYTELEKSVKWLESLNFQTKIVIAGEFFEPSTTAVSYTFCAEQETTTSPLMNLSMQSMAIVFTTSIHNPPKTAVIC